MILGVREWNSRIKDLRNQLLDHTMSGNLLADRSRLQQLVKDPSPDPGIRAPSLLLCLLSERAVLALIFHLFTEGVSPCRVENGLICYNEIGRTSNCRDDERLCSMVEVSPCPRNSPCSQQCGDGRRYACNCSCLGPCFHCFIGALLGS